MRVLSSLIESDDGEIVRGSLTFNLHYVSRMKWVQARNVQVRGFHQTKITSNIHWQVKCYIQFSVTSAGFSSDIRVSQYAPWMSETDWVLRSENIKQFNPNKNITTGGLLMLVCLTVPSERAKLFSRVKYLCGFASPGSSGRVRGAERKRCERSWTFRYRHIVTLRYR